MNAQRFLPLLVISSVIVWVQTGCFHNVSVTRRSQLPDAASKVPITVMTTDNKKYTFVEYVMDDSSVSGSAILENETEKKDPVSIAILFSDISYVHIREISIWRGLFSAVAVGWFVLTALDSYNSDNPLSITPVVSYHWPGGMGGGSSCPFIYGWNGTEYIMEGEAIAIAWGRAMEITTCGMLPSVVDTNGTIKVRIANERPETHYINHTSLFAIESDRNAVVYPDPHNRFWPVYATTPPISAVDHRGNTVAATLAAHDQQYWESPNAGYEDIVDLTFRTSSLQNDGSLVIHAINTDIFDEVIRIMASLVGDHTIEFVQALEHDTGMICLVKDWLAESSLKAFIWSGTEWEQIGVLLPEANAVPFSRVIRFSAANIQGDSVRIRLTGLADVWKLDAVGVEWNSVLPLNPVRCSMLSANKAEDVSVQQAVARADEKYSVLFPSDAIDLTFRSHQSNFANKITYVLAVRGYLHEWFPQEPNTTQFEFVNDISGEAKITFLKSLLRQKNVFLPVLYARWRDSKKASLIH